MVENVSASALKEQGRQYITDGPPEVNSLNGGDERYPKVREAIGQIKAAFDEMTHNIKDYSKDASLEKVLADAKSAVNEMLEKAVVLADKSKEIPTKSLSKLIVAANTALEKVKIAAKKYDQEHKVTKKVTDTLKPGLDKCSAAVNDISQHVSEAATDANAQLQGVNDFFQKKIQDTASKGLNFLVDTFADLDLKYSIRDKTKDAVKGIDETFGLQDKAGALDEKFAIGENIETTAKKLDSLTKGRLLSSYEQGVRMATDGMEYIEKELEKAYNEKKETSTKTEQK